MYGKTILAALLVVFVARQSVQGKSSKTLTCYSYDKPLSFQHPKIQICDQKSSEHTHNQLTKYFPALSMAANKDFHCLSISYVLENSTIMAVGGCISSEMNTCSVNPLNKTWHLKDCRSCSTNLCTLPAGVNSTSSHANMIGSGNSSSISSIQSVHHSLHSSSTSILISSIFVIGLLFVNMAVR